MPEKSFDDDSLPCDYTMTRYNFKSARITVYCTWRSYACSWRYPGSISLCI